MWFHRAQLLILFFLMPLLGCSGTLLPSGGDGEAIHGGDLVDLALRGAKLKLIQAVGQLKSGQNLSLFGVRPSGCENRYQSGLCSSLDSSGSERDFVKAFLTRNTNAILALDAAGSLNFVPTAERKFQMNSDGTNREVLAWTTTGSNGKPVIYFNQEVRDLAASSLLALVTHEMGHLLLDTQIGHKVTDEEEIRNGGVVIGSGRWLLDAAGAFLAIYQGEVAAAIAPGTPTGNPAQLPALTERNLMALTFDEGQGNSTFRDVSGNGNGAECRAGSPCIGAGSGGPFGAAYRFNGSNELLRVRPNAGLQPNGADFTLSAWIFPTEHKPLIRVIHKVTDFLPRDDGYYIATASGRAWWHLGNGSVAMEVVDSKVLTLGVWHWIVGTWNSATSTGTLYVDGVKVAEQVTAIPRISPTGDFTIGGRAGAPTETFAGSIDEVGAWNRTMSAAEVARLFTGLVSLSR